MKKIIFVLSSVIVAFIASVGINATTAPVNMYVEPGTHSCVVTWEDEENSAWNLRYRPFSDEPDEPVLLHSITASSYTGSYNAVTLPAPWGGTNVRAGNQEIYFRNNYNNSGSYGNITYTIPDGYNGDTFTMMITTYAANSNGAGNFTVSTPQTDAVTHKFSAGETFYWVVTASSGEKITITTPDSQYSPSISLMAVYYGDASGSKSRANEWTYVNNLNKTTYTIEDLEIETDYEVQVQAIGANGTVSDWTRPDVFTTLAEEPILTSVHILGDINDNQAWSPFAGTKMEYDPETELYTATILVWAGASFGFTTEIDDNEDMGAWEYVNRYRFGPESNGILELTNEVMGQQLPLAFVTGYGDIKVLSDGYYEVIVSLEQNYVKVGKVGNLPHGYAKGDVNHDLKLDVTDVTLLIGEILNDTNTLCEICADVNEDTKLDVTDVTLLIGMILENQ